MTDATTRTYVGTATSASEDGSVYVALSQDVTLPDDDDGTHGLGVEMPTTVNVDEGDEVIVTVFGGGVMKAPVVTGNPGWGDSIQTQVDNAETLATEAQEVAQATGQNFWPDTDGVHVTQVTKDEWNDSTSPNYHSGANVLLNALGQLFRDGLNNLLALLPAHYRTDEFTGDGTTTAFTLSVTPYEVTSVTVAGTTLADVDWSASGDVVTLTTAPADGAVVSVAYRTSATSIAIFDGNGNESGNVVADFSEDGVSIGRQSSLNSLFNSLGIYFRNGAANLMTLVAGKHYYHESTITASTQYVSLAYYPVSIISVTLDGVETDEYEAHGRYVTITATITGSVTCRVDYRSSPSLNMYPGDGSSSLVAQLSANLVWLARGGFRINVNEGPYASEWRGSMSLVQDTQHNGGLALGVRANGSSYVTMNASGTGGSGSLVLDSDRSLTLHYLDKFSFVDGDVTTEQAYAVLSSPVTLFTGTYAQTYNTAVTLSESASNFSRLVFICENNDGERTSVTVTDPNGKHFNVVMLTIAGPSGTGTYAYMKAKSFSINGTSVTCRTYMYNGQTIYRHGSVTLRNGVAVSATQASEEFGIVKVLGCR